MKLQRVSLLLLLGALLLPLASGCSRGLPHEKRPASIIPDMEVQRKFRVGGQTELFADGRMMRPLVYGTVARGTLQEDVPFYYGFTNLADSTRVARMPVTLDRALLDRGQERYNIYCSPCHSQTGVERGIVVTRGGLVPPPSFAEARLVNETDGHLFHVISNGVRTMPGYAKQIPAEDRWAIVAYIRALQRAQTATQADVPADKRGDLR